MYVESRTITREGGGWGWGEHQLSLYYGFSLQKIDEFLFCHKLSFLHMAFSAE
jgi:hypothetical protein